MSAIQNQFYTLIAVYIYIYIYISGRTLAFILLDSWTSKDNSLLVPQKVY